MPTYEYRCQKCHKIIETILPMDKREECAPTCCNQKAELLISSVAFKVMGVPRIDAYHEGVNNLRP